MVEKSALIQNCKLLISAYKSGGLGQTEMPENTNPFCDKGTLEERLIYFTLPMALNYQRNSYTLWEAAKKTWEDPETHNVFIFSECFKMTQTEIRQKLTKHKLALQPNKHIDTWLSVSKTIHREWGSIERLLTAADSDFLKLKKLVQTDHKKGFPYLSGPKIFNYWCYILSEYCDVEFSNSEYIDIAPDTHITKCSVKLEVITKNDAELLTKDQISARWRDVLSGSGINPIDMHAPLWFWSRNGFIYELPENL